ncbi:hypothetical protein V2J09_015715 [Rumex salicifolius]
MSAPSVSLVRLWRTAFLTLRDETLTPRSSDTSFSIGLLDDLILSQSRSFVSAAPLLPSDEVSSDLLFLVDLCAANCNESAAQVLAAICDLIRDVAFAVPLSLSSSAWTQMLDCFAKLSKFFLHKKSLSLGIGAVDKSALICLDISRHLISLAPRRSSPSENIQLLKFLLSVIECCHTELHNAPNESRDGDCKSNNGTLIPKWSCIWKVQSTSFWMVGEVFSNVGSSLPVGIGQAALEVLRKVADLLSSKNIHMEDSNFSRYYASFLECLHLVLANSKGSLSDHVAALIATLRLFLTYGSSNVKASTSQKKNNDLFSSSCDTVSGGVAKAISGVYKPPHLRNRSVEQSAGQPSKIASRHHFSMVDFTSSDSDYSDNERSADGSQPARSRKARAAAILCIQDLCEADPKAFAAQWTMLLPTNDVLHPRKCETTLMACLMFDPHVKVRLAAASAIAAMIEGASSVVLQVAEYKDSSRYGSYMSLSSSLGHILMQLHTGILHLIEREANTGLLMSLLKILMLLITSTPYLRMPPELLPMVLLSLHERIVEGFCVRSDQTGLQAIALSCVAALVSVSPCSAQVEVMFKDEISRGLIMGKKGAGVFSTLFHYADWSRNPALSFEALQALRAVCHNYPDSVLACWLHVSGLLKVYLRPDAAEVRLDNGPVGSVGGLNMEKVIAAAVKVLDEFLRAVTGFRGTEDVDGDRIVEIPFTDDLKRDKRISSAPSYGAESLKDVSDESKTGTSGVLEWDEAIEKHLALALRHTSAMVRAASVTCFAGITSAAFFSLTEKKQDFILLSCIGAATNDDVPSVRSAACRAIGVLACFPDISRSAEILKKIVNAAEINTHHHLISVRIPASWAIANICDSLRHCYHSSLGFQLNFQIVESLSKCALRLTKDGDKVKSNAVRALGNIARVVPFSSPATCNLGSIPERHCQGNNLNSVSALDSLPPNNVSNINLLEQIVQTFLSCITTGNVKVQWNVCHALSNLFLNGRVHLQHMGWAPSVYSVLLVLLRDSSNFKIRIQAAAALAVPSSMLDYGRSFSDVVQGVEHVVENLSSDHSAAPSNFKYRISLEKQLTLTMLHMLGLCSNDIDDPLKEFLIKKVSFLEEWLSVLCSSLEEAHTTTNTEVQPKPDRKFDLISRALGSLIKVYEGKDQSAHARRFSKVLSYLEDQNNI